MGLIDAVGDGPIALDTAVFVDIDRPLLRAAALRPRHVIKTPDTLQVAAACALRVGGRRPSVRERVSGEPADVDRRDLPHSLNYFRTYRSGAHSV